jgi:uncharacterized protein YceH (UPF0502 family)
MALELTIAHRRVLGVLVEKAFTTPEQYPLTLNALVTGCNQKSNRYPVFQFSEGEVADTLQELMKKGLVRRADSPRGARSVRYEHIVQSACGWAPREQAILAELMLRGPQTVGELRGRADRMSKMPNLEYVEGVLNELGSQDPPLVRVLPRTPGRSAVRYAHTLYPEDEETVELEPQEVSSRPAARSSSSLDARLNEIERRIEALEERMGRLVE